MHMKNGSIARAAAVVIATAILCGIVPMIGVLLYYLIRKKNWFISDKNIDWFLFLICYYIHRESGNVEL